MIPFPKKKYSIIYADPPWSYENTQHNSVVPCSSSDNHYPTMSYEELVSLKVSSISDTDCLLFLWTTGPNLDIGVQLGVDWGFKYITIGFVWDKTIPNPGNYTMSECEFCLVFKKGKIPQPRGSRSERQLLSVKRGEHSEKPLEIRYRIDKMFPEHRKIELFARPLPLERFIPNPNWDYWGNDDNVYSQV